MLLDFWVGLGYNKFLGDKKMEEIKFKVSKYVIRDFCKKNNVDYSFVLDNIREFFNVYGDEGLFEEFLEDIIFKNKVLN